MDSRWANFKSVPTVEGALVAIELDGEFIGCHELGKKGAWF
jgi:hypothetical protein